MTSTPTPSKHALHSTGSTLELKLNGVLTSSDAREIYEVARQVSGTGQDLLICCERVEFLGTGVLQCLIALTNSLASQGKQLRFVGVQPALEKWLFLAGLV